MQLISSLQVAKLFPMVWTCRIGSNWCTRYMKTAHVHQCSSHSSKISCWDLPKQRTFVGNMFAANETGTQLLFSLCELIGGVTNHFLPSWEHSCNSHVESVACRHHEMHALVENQALLQSIVIPRNLDRRSARSVHSSVKQPKLQVVSWF